MKQLKGPNYFPLGMRIHCVIPNNLERLALMFQKQAEAEKRSHNGLAGKLLQRRFGVDLSNPHARRYSQQYGPAGWWAQLLMEAAPTLSTLVVTPSLEQLGLDAEWVYQNFNSFDAFSKIMEQARGLGLLPCSLSVVPALILSDLVLPMWESLVMVTEPIDIAIDRTKPFTDHHLFCSRRCPRDQFVVSAGQTDVLGHQFFEGLDVHSFGPKGWHRTKQWERLARHSRFMFQLPDPRPQVAPEVTTKSLCAPTITEVSKEELFTISNMARSQHVATMGGIKEKTPLLA